MSRHAQKKMLRKARKKLDISDYPAAKDKYLSLLQADSANFDYNYEMGLAHFYSVSEKLQAIPYFERAQRHFRKDTTGELFFYLGECYHIKGRFDDAIHTYQRYLDQIRVHGTFLYEKDEKELVSDIELRMQQCENAKTVSADPVSRIKVNGKEREFRIVNPGSTINSTAQDYSPVLSPNDSTLFFTSRREGSTGGKREDDGKFYEDIYYSTFSKDGWSKALNIGPPINTKKHDASNFISFDGKTLYIYKGIKQGSIYQSTKTVSGWTKPVEAGKNNHVNTKAWETSFGISIYDNTMFLVSDRKGGLGGRDIYKAEKQKDGTWGALENIGAPINTPYNEDAPFLSPDGKTLYFSSTGHNSMGGFDIFYCERTATGWSEPRNLGYPLNSPGDDIYFILNSKGDKGYFSSSREHDGLADMDIYSIEMECENIPMARILGFAPPATVIYVTQKDSKKKTEEYNAGADGKYEIQLAPGNSYLFYFNIKGADSTRPAEISIPKQCREFTLYQDLKIDTALVQDISSGNTSAKMTGTFSNLFFENKSFEKEVNRMAMANAIALARKEHYNDFSEITAYAFTKAAPKTGTKPLLASFSNVMFDFNKANIREGFEPELDRILNYLNKNANAQIEISGHTDEKGSDSYNKKLSVQRANAVKNYFVNKGIKAERIQTIGYGKTKPLADNSSDEGRAKNRRVEFRVIIP